MLKISNLSFSYTEQTLLDHVNLTLSGRQIVAIIGDNGSGKTTLLDLIAGELAPDDGAIIADGRIGYLHQTNDNLINKSGGERTQICLRCALNKHPDILLLDEPTNNLDSKAKQWLVNELMMFNGLVLMASHDRSFIDQVANKLIEIHDGRANIYNGNYSDYLHSQRLINDEKWLAYNNALTERRRLTKRVNQLRSETRSVSHRHYDKHRDEDRMAWQSKRGHVQAATGRAIKSVGARLRRLDNIEKPHERKQYVAHVTATFLRNRRLVQVVDLSMSYGDKVLFNNITFDIWTGQRWRIAGGNGSGKSTLCRIILDEIKATQGIVKVSPNVQIGYISQDQPNLDMSRCFLEQIGVCDLAEVYKAASTMDFSPSDMRRPVGQLSRGQITKLAILKIILCPSDLLILDEITNHLDIRAQENIENALSKYPGAILLVTHNERFAESLRIKNEIAVGS